MQKIQLKKILFSSGIILIIIGVLWVLNLDTKNLKSNAINDCSSEEANLQEARQLAEEPPAPNNDIREKAEEAEYCESKLNALGSELNAEKADWQEKTDQEKVNWYDKKDSYDALKDTCTSLSAEANGKTLGYNEYIREVYNPEKLKREARVRELEKVLEDCQNKPEDTTSGTSGTSGTGTDTSGTGTDTTSGTGTDTSGTTTEYCGDGTCNNGENSDTCSSDCPRSWYCGDGNQDSGEECDGGTDCDSSCHKTNTPYCGNGTVDAGEDCDGWDHCDSSCHQVAYCGDGNTDAGEECDGGENCDSTCHKTASCGNGTVDSGEECDDNNTTDGDGCDSSCIEECDPDAGGLWSSFFGLNFGGFGSLQSTATQWKNCKKKGCMIKAAENFDDKAEEDDKSCTCKNDLDPYQYDTCRCQPTHPWCYHPKNGECVKSKWLRKFVVGLIRGAGQDVTNAVAPWVWCAVPKIPMACDFKLYKPKSLREMYWIAQAELEQCK